MRILACCNCAEKRNRVPIISENAPMFFERLVFECALPSKYHCHAVFVGGGDNLLVGD